MKSEKYKGYVLISNPRKLEGDKFVTNLIVQKWAGDTVTETPIYPDNKQYSTIAEAHDFALGCGRHWVDSQ